MCQESGEAVRGPRAGPPPLQQVCGEREPALRTREPPGPPKSLPVFFFRHSAQTAAGCLFRGISATAFWSRDGAAADGDGWLRAICRCTFCWHTCRHQSGPPAPGPSRVKPVTPKALRLFMPLSLQPIIRSGLQDIVAMVL